MWDRALESSRTPCLQSPQTLKFFSFPPGSHSPWAAVHGARTSEYLGFSLGASPGCLAGGRGEGEGDVAPGPRCPVLCGPGSRDPRSVNGLSKDNFCFSFAVGGVALQPAMKNAPFPETLALVIYVGTVLTREAWAAQAGLRVEGGGPAWRRTWCPGCCSARFKGALLHPYLQDLPQRLPRKPSSLSR